MKDTVKLGVILLVISAVAAGLLGFSNAVTSERIAEADKIANEQARQKLLGEAESFVTLMMASYRKLPVLVQIY